MVGAAQIRAEAPRGVPWKGQRGVLDDCGRLLNVPEKFLAHCLKELSIPGDVFLEVLGSVDDGFGFGVSSLTAGHFVVCVCSVLALLV